MLKFEVKMCVVGNVVFVVYFKSGTSEILLEKAFRLLGRSAFTFIHSFPSSSPLFAIVFQAYFFKPFWDSWRKTQ